jgi:hypothetical protein
MKKIALFCVSALFVSLFSTGCSTSGTSWCRSGSLFPLARAKQAEQTIYTAAALTSACNPCEPAACDPCEPACAPCEPACDPCQPACDPCASRTRVFTPGITPGPVQ